MLRGRVLHLSCLLVASGLAACSLEATQSAGEPAPSGGMPPPLTLAERPSATGGERLYVEKCGMCHGPGAMGTGLLARRVDQPLLEQRKDLTAAYVIQAVRMGIANMPAMARGEVSDDEMAQIANYLAGGAAGRAP